MWELCRLLLGLDSVDLAPRHSVRLRASIKDAPTRLSIFPARQRSSLVHILWPQSRLRCRQWHCWRYTFPSGTRSRRYQRHYRRVAQLRATVSVRQPGFASLVRAAERSRYVRSQARAHGRHTNRRLLHQHGSRNGNHCAADRP